MLNKISKSFFVFVVVSVLIMASLPFSVSAASTYSNLADPKSSEWHNDERLDNTGAYVAANGYVITNLISIKSRSAFHIKGFSLTNGKTYNRIYMYSSSGAYLGYRYTNEMNNSYTLYSFISTSDYDKNVSIFDISSAISSNKLLSNTAYISFGAVCSNPLEVIITADEKIIDSDSEYNYLVRTNDISTLWGLGSILYCTNLDEPKDEQFDNGEAQFTSSGYVMYYPEENKFMEIPYIRNSYNLEVNTVRSIWVNIPWVMDTSIFSADRDYILDFDLCVVSNFGETTSGRSLEYYRIGFGTAGGYITVKPTSLSVGSTENVIFLKFRFSVAGNVLLNLSHNCNFVFYNCGGMPMGLYMGLKKGTFFSIREYTQAEQSADAIAGIGSDIAQPDFGGANDSLGTTADDLKSFDEEYKIDMEQTSADLESGMSTLNGTDMQKASIQVKNWIERFANENNDYVGFLIGGLTLAVCFWVIGRKGWEK